MGKAKEIMRNLKPWQSLIVILLLGIAVRAIFFSGMGMSDSLAYSRAAHDLTEGGGIDPEGVLTLTTRIGLTGITALSYSIFGINDVSAAGFVLITSIGGIVLIYLFAKLLFNERTGLIAAFFLAIFPLDVFYSTRLISDIPSAVLMSAGVYAFLYSEKKKVCQKTLCLFSGLLIGAGYLIRESALLIALFFIAYISWRLLEERSIKAIRPGYFLVPAGVLLVLLLEAGIFLSITGDPFYRTSASQEYVVEGSAKHDFFGRLDFPVGLLHYPWLLATDKLLNLFYIPAILAALWLMIRRERKAFEMLLWLVPIGLYLSFGTTSFTQYSPFRAVDRYTTILTVPALLILAYAIERLTSDKKALLAAILALFAAGSIAMIHLHDNRDLLRDLDQAYIVLKGLDKTAHIDSRSIDALEYLSEYNLERNILPYPETFLGVENAYVVVNRLMLRNVKEANPDTTYPEEITNPPETWQSLAEFGKDPRDRITIYYLPGGEAS